MWEGGLQVWKKEKKFRCGAGKRGSYQTSEGHLPSLLKAISSHHLSHHQQNSTMCMTKLLAVKLHHGGCIRKKVPQRQHLPNKLPQLMVKARNELLPSTKEQQIKWEMRPDHLRAAGLIHKAERLTLGICSLNFCHLFGCLLLQTQTYIGRVWNIKHWLAKDFLSLCSVSRWVMNT